MVCQVNGNSSILPLHLHFLALGLENNKRVLIASSELTEMNYRLICSKAGVRWTPSLINFIPLIHLNAGFDFNIEDYFTKIKQKVSEYDPDVVLLDDLSSMFSEMKKKKAEVLLLAPFYTNCEAREMLRQRCSSFANISPIGHGFGKNASAKCVVSMRNSSRPTVACSLILSGERSNNGTIVGGEAK
ncbi:unnamed protein product [Caenorhabditis auriculariae]|uniref:Uncharacterized protein n=1 Tax=Caenorhabditis auriculariae TaxID=2777116 RepID=A0A8S1HID1_9PELO|nr:unnamed protein product [Caenorhabditis auriculariae]